MKRHKQKHENTNNKKGGTEKQGKQTGNTNGKTLVFFHVCCWSLLFCVLSFIFVNDFFYYFVLKKTQNMETDLRINEEKL